MYAMNIQNDVIGLALRENYESKQVTDFIAWPSGCHDTICQFSIINYKIRNSSIKREYKKKNINSINRPVRKIYVLQIVVKDELLIW
jgi:hypothetical protein